MYIATIIIGTMIGTEDMSVMMIPTSSLRLETTIGHTVEDETRKIGF